MAIIFFNKPSSGGTPGDLLPDQAGNEGKFLQTDGTNASWETIIQTQQIEGEADTNFSYTFLEGDFKYPNIENAILRYAIFNSGLPASFTLRINENPATDMFFELNGLTPLSHHINEPIFPGSIIEIINQTEMISFRFYYA